MFFYNRPDLSEGIESNSSKYMACRYWLFNHGFKFQDSVCKGCHDLIMLCLNISDIAMITVKVVDYCFIIHDIIKSKVIN